MSTPQDLPPLPPRSVPTKPEPVNPGKCEHEWIQDIWMSGHAHTSHPRLESETEIPQLRLIPLFRCVKCGLIRLPVAEDAIPPVSSPGAPSHL